MTRPTVIIPTIGRSRLLADTLESLAASGSAPEEVLVVDGDAAHSSRPIVETAAAAHPHLGIRYLTAQRGLCRQRNTAIEQAVSEVIVFLDDDVLLETQAIDRLLAAFKDPDVAAATGHTVERSGRRLGLKHSRLRRLMPGTRRQGHMTPSGYPTRLWDVNREQDIEFLNGCWMAVRTEVARQLRFDEELERTGGYALAEDEDFGYRVSRVARVRFVPDARLEHRNMGFSSADHHAFNRAMILNRAYLSRKNFPQTAIARGHFLLVVALFFVHRAINREWRGIAGLVAGLRDVRTDPRRRP